VGLDTKSHGVDVVRDTHNVQRRYRSSASSDDRKITGAPARAAGVTWLAADTHDASGPDQTAGVAADKTTADAIASVVNPDHLGAVGQPEILAGLDRGGLSPVAAIVIEAEATAAGVSFLEERRLTGAHIDVRVAAVVVVCDKYLASNVRRVWPAQSQDVAGAL
jgi:hypothetical protein